MLLKKQLYCLLILSFTGLLFPVVKEGQAQCTSPNFALPASGCIDQNITIINNSTDQSDEFIWDFCSGDLSNVPTASSLTSIYGAPFKVKIVEVNNNFYGFFFSRTNQKLYRLDFGASLSSTPIVNDLGNLGISSNQLLSVEIIQEGSLFYGLIIQFSPSRIHRINFGASIENLPVTATNLGNFGGLINGPIDLIAEKDDNSFIAFLLNYNDNKLIKLDFGSSVTNDPDATAITIANGNGGGLAIQRECEDWYIVTTLIAPTGKIFKIAFGSALNNDAPTITELTLSNAIANPLGIAFVREGEKYYCFVQTASTLNRVTFSSLGNNSVAVTNLGNLGVFTNSWALSLAEDKGRWFGFSSSNSGSNIYLVSYPNNCGASPSWYKGTTPPTVKYSFAGTHNVSLTSIETSGATRSSVQAFQILSSLAPDISIQTDSVECFQAPKSFSVYSESTLTSASWQFGDGQSSASSSPTIIYSAAGSYSVTVTATSTNGCQNTAYKNVQVYNPPVSSFIAPSGNPLCTNQLFTFTNTSAIDPGLNPEWEWLLNDVSISSSQDLQYSFADPSSKTIKLRASIPGCIDESTHVISTLQTGPEVDFTFNGICQQETTNFINGTSGTVTDYLWEFGDSQTSSEPNPVHVYSTIGEYNITLQANSPNGCQNSASKTIDIRSKPQPNFSIALPPFSCSGTPTQFSDNTPNPVDSNISSWLWEFNDPESSQNSATVKNPQHTYNVAGDYPVSLTVTTNYGCSNTIQKSVTISQSPVADFIHSPACDDVPVAFDALGSDISSWYWQIENTFFFIDNPQYTFTIPNNYQVSLTVTGANNCTNFIQKTINVPIPLTANFSVEKNCVGFPAEFSDETAEVNDPIVNRHWTFGSETISESNPSVTFTHAGMVPVKLDVTTQSGCVYSTIKNVEIVDAPQAFFTATPEIGVPPLHVTFTNGSVHATNYLWRFNDESDSTTTEHSTEFAFQEYGEYVVDLTAANEQNCSHTYSRIITVSEPVNNVSLTTFLLEENPGGEVNAILTIKNSGNVALQNLKLLIEISGVEIAEVIPGPVLPQATITYIPAFNIIKSSQLKYVCAGIELQGDIDVKDNQRCASLENDIMVFEPYPNPSQNYVNLEWITDESLQTTISIFDALGSEMHQTHVSSKVGLNQHSFDVTGIKSGIYFIQFNTGTRSQKYRLVISR